MIFAITLIVFFQKTDETEIYVKKQKDAVCGETRERENSPSSRTSKVSEGFLSF